MALDIHIADSLDAATRNAPRVSIDLQTHTAFFRTELANGCPMLLRMNDYYSDCRFAGQELRSLKDEVDGMITRMSPTSPYHRWMQQLQEACETALSENCSIFALSD